MALFAAPTLSTEVDYAFSDKNGNGWVQQEGKVTIELELSGPRASLHIAGKSAVKDAVLQSDMNVKVERSERPFDERFPLTEVTRTGATIRFRLEAHGEKLEGHCAPATVPGIPSKRLVECTFTGFRWHEQVQLPALHHPLIFERPSKRPIRNLMSGSTSTGQGTRRVERAR